MATKSIKVSKLGFCKIDNDKVPISIEYISSPENNGRKRNVVFVKNSNQCRYLAEGKCDMGRECQIYKEAEIEIVRDL